MYFYLGKAIVYKDLKEKEETCFCITTANTYAEAMKKMTRYWGEAETLTIEITYLNDAECEEISKDFYLDKKQEVLSIF